MSPPALGSFTLIPFPPRGINTYERHLHEITAHYHTPTYKRTHNQIIHTYILTLNALTNVYTSQFNPNATTNYTHFTQDSHMQKMKHTHTQSK